MIVKDEEETLANCLNSVKDIVDEIIIVDTGSKDATKAVALSFTPHVYDFVWVDDFAKARNAAFSYATMDYLFWLDADDMLLPQDAEKLAALKQNLDPSVDSIMFRYNTGFDESGNVTFHYYRERLARRANNPQWHEPVHEYLEILGKALTVDIAVTHCKKHSDAPPTSRNLEIYEARVRNGEPLSARGAYYYARELRDNGRFEDAAKVFIQFLDSGKGWIEDNIAACAQLAYCYERQKMPQEQIAALFKSFSYDIPRADICCDIGYWFKDQKEYRKAIYWFRVASELDQPKDNWGFIREDCYGFIPYIEMAVCYDRLGNHIRAAEMNERAAKFKPDSEAVRLNRQYFISVLEKMCPAESPQ
jgi:glycosyltransferase involved in cell wall biosynthesis